MKKITLIIALCVFAQFANAQDTCATAVPLTTAGLYVVGPINGTEAPPDPFCAPNAENIAQSAEWYAYTPTQDYSVTVSTNIVQNTPRTDTRVRVYTGACGSLVCHAGDDDSGTNLSSVVRFNVVANTTYHIAFDNAWSSNGFTFQLIEDQIVIPSPAPVAFTPQTIPTIITGGDNYNKCVVDMNNDYKDDIVSVTRTNIRVHYQNNDGSFTMTDIPTEFADHDAYWSLAAGDYNKDGFNDLLYGDGGGATFMKSNSTGTAYTKVSPGQSIFCQRTNFVDLNNDGNLDAFSCHDIDPNVYYINDGAGNFTYYQSGVTPGAYSLGVIPSGGNYASLWTDYDNDGDVDLFISKCSGPPCELHRNDGNGVFTDISAIAGINATPVQSWSSAIADFDNDGDMDILVGSNGSTSHMFFKNNLDKSNTTEEAFTNITAGSGWDLDTSNNRDYIAYDFDNDGFVDVMGGGNKIMFNKGDNTFATVLYPGMSLGAVGDFNNDGFLDIQNGSRIFKNGGNANKWITVNLKGIESNSNGIGARVEIYGTWGVQIRDVRSGEGFGYMSTLNTHFGIGSANEITKLVVKWPSGTQDVILNPTLNRSLFVAEGSSPELGINDNEKSAFSVYPNPVKNVINIKSKSTNASIKTAEIYSLDGKRLMITEVKSLSIPVENLTTGTYILLLKDTEGKIYKNKFLKN